MGLEVLSICPLNLGFNRARADHLIWLCPHRYTWSCEELTVICVLQQDHEQQILMSGKKRPGGLHINNIYLQAAF